MNNELNNKIVNLKNLSLTGRLCYLFMCIEKYLVSCYADRDWKLVAKRCWQWTNVYWNEGCDIYSQVVPKFLFEFDNYTDTNKLAFDGRLSYDDYLELMELYAGITNGSEEDEINQMLWLPVEFNNQCECSDFSYADEPTLSIISRAQAILIKNNIDCPDIDKISHLSKEQKNGWGEFMNSEQFSVII